MAANPIVQSYLSDNSVDMAKRQGVLDALKAGQSDTDIASMISQKYGDKYAGATSPQSGAISNFIAKGVSSFSPANVGAAAVQGIQGLAKYAQSNGQKISMTPISSDARNQAVQDLNSHGVTPDSGASEQDLTKQVDTANAINQPYQPQSTTDQVLSNLPFGAGDAYKMMNKSAQVGAALSGQKQGNSFGKNLENNVSQGTGEIVGGTGDMANAAGTLLTDPNKAAQDPTAMQKGFQRIIGGGIQTLTSPASATVQSAPEAVQNPVNSVMNAPNVAIGNVMKAIIPHLNPNLSQDYIEQNIVKPLQLAMQVGVLANPEAAMNTVEKGADLAKNVAGKVMDKTGEGLKTAGKYATSQVSGLSPDTISTAIENPDLLGKAQKAGIDQSRADTFDMIKHPIDQLASDISDTGKSYAPIRNEGSPVQMPQNWLDQKLDEWGLKPDKNGDLRATTKSDVRNPADVAAIQKFYDMWKDTGNAKAPMDSAEFLNMRSDLADVAKYDLTGKTKASQDFARDTRSSLNDTARNQIPGLEELDNKFADLKPRLDEVKGLIYKADGTLKDNAVSAVNNLLNKGKENLLVKIQDSLPGFDAEKFAQQVKVTKALEDVKMANGQKVGHYVKAGLVGGVIGGGGIGGVIGLVIGNPEVMTTILKAYGKAREIKGDVVANIADKINNGIKPTGSEITFVQQALSKVKPTAIRALIKTPPTSQT